MGAAFWFANEGAQSRAIGPQEPRHEAGGLDLSIRREEYGKKSPEPWSTCQKFLFDPPLQLPGNVTVRTLDDAAAFTQNYKTPRQPMIRDGVLRRLEGASTLEEERNAANASAMPSARRRPY